MRKLTRKQILARLFVGFFTLGSLLCTVNSAVAGGDILGKFKINDGSETTFTRDSAPIKPSGSGNSVVVNIYGGSEGPTPYIYGGEVSEDNISNNSVKITTEKDSITKLSNVYGGCVDGTGSANSNTVTIKDSIALDSTIYGGYTNNGDANSNTVEITNSKTATVWGGYIKSESATGNTNSNTLKLTNCEINAGNIVAAENNGTGDGVENTVEVSGGIINIGLISGAQLLSGDAILNKVTISDLDSPATYTNIIGGTVTNGNAYSNAVTLDNLKELNCTLVAGGYVVSDEAASNTVTINNSSVKGQIYGGYVVSGEAASNTITINNSSVKGLIYGGYIEKHGNVVSNEVSIDGSNVTGTVNGGYDNGDDVDSSAIANTIAITNGSTVTGMVHGGFVKQGKVASNAVTISESTVKAGGVYGGRANNGEVSSNTVTVTNGSILNKVVYGGQVGQTGNTTYNIVDIAASAVNNNVYGGYTRNDKTSSNTVAISNGSVITGDVYGGNIIERGDATYNVVYITASTVNGNVYGGRVGTNDTVGTGDAVSNKVKISDNSKITGSVYGGHSSSGNAVTGNELIIAGTGNEIGGSVENFESVSFKLASDDDTAKPMFSVGGSMDLNQIKLDSELPESGLNGEITLVDGKISAENAVYTINGTAVDGDKSLTFAQKNDSSVNVGFYKYVLSESAIKLNAESTIAAAFQQSGKDPLSTDDRKIVVTSELANKYSRIYGAFNTDGGDATNATVELSEAVSNENLTIYGGYSTGSGVDVITGNTLKVLKNGNKIKDILNFSNLDFSLDSDNSNNPTMLSLAADTVDLSKASINVNLANALAEGQTVTLLSAAQQLNLTNDMLTINNKKLDSDLSLKIVDDSSKKYVNVADYSLNNASGKLSITANESFITSKYINGDKSKSVEKIDLTNDLSGFKNIYGSYSADNSVAEGGIISINEKVDLSQTTLIGGKATDNGTVGKNTLEISSAAAGSKVNGVSKFSDVNVKLDSAIAEGQTVTLLEANKLELSDSVFTINNKMLDSNLSLKFATYGGNNEYVNVGGYSMANDGSKLTVTADESILTSKYTNGNESLAVEKFELTNDFSNFKAIYGSYSADNSAAEGGKLFINEAVNLSETTLIGGKSAGNGEVKNNTLEISSAAAGSKINGAEKFDNYKFVLGSDLSNGATVLSSNEQVNLANATVDAELSGMALNKGEKVVLLDNADKSDAVLKLNGNTGDRSSVAENNGTFLVVNRYGYNTDDSKIAIECKDTFAAGAFLDEKGNIVGNKTLTLGGSTASNMRAGYERASSAPDISECENIYGIYSEGDSIPSGGVVEIVSPIQFNNCKIHGGYSTKRGYWSSGNTLKVDTLNARVRAITHFEIMEFNLPSETRNGSIMLTVADSLDLEPTKKITVNASKATNNLKVGDKVRLINCEGGIKHFSKQEKIIKGLTDKISDIALERSSLNLLIKGEQQNNNTKAPVEAISATTALVNYTSELVAGKLNRNMVMAVDVSRIDAAKDNSENNSNIKTVPTKTDFATFAALSGGNLTYNTGSYVKSDSWNVGFGIGKKGMSSKNPDATYGLFFQYGKSNFSTHNDGGYRGDGDSKMFGAGLMFHQEANSKYYYQGSISAGKVDADWSCKDGSYDDKATYYSMTFGMGHKHNVGGNKTMDVYGRYSFNHVGSMEGDLNGDKYDFDSTNSHNLRFGFRMEYAKKNAATAYWGLAWEHEFAGASGATLTTPNIVERTASPSLKGDSGIAEVGYQWKRGNWEYNINAEGSFGKREGVTGSFNINYNF